MKLRELFSALWYNAYEMSKYEKTKANIRVLKSRNVQSKKARVVYEVKPLFVSKRSEEYVLKQMEEKMRSLDNLLLSE